MTSQKTLTALRDVLSEKSRYANIHMLVKDVPAHDQEHEKGHPRLTGEGWHVPCFDREPHAMLQTIPVTCWFRKQLVCHFAAKYMMSQVKLL